MVSEVKESTFAANGTTKALATPTGKASIAHGFHLMGKCFREIPAFLKAKKYVVPETSHDTPFQVAFGTDKNFLDWMPTQPFYLGNFLGALPGYMGPKPWTDGISLAEKLQSADKSAPLFLDVGGGSGHQCVAFRKATAERFPGRVILQDLPGALDAAPTEEGVEKMAQNFFEGQAVKGGYRSSHSRKALTQYE